jgi:hypothetical protein
MSTDTKMLNLQKVLARLRRVPQAMQDAAAGQLKTEVDDLVAAQKRAAPVDESSPEAGKLRDSIHAYENPDRPLSYRIIADAKDDDGKFIGSNIEAGHRARDGTHVAGRPSFFPTYRARKKGMKRRMSAASRKAAQALFPES